MNSNDEEEIILGDVCLKIGSGVTPRGGGNVYKEEGVSLIAKISMTIVLNIMDLRLLMTSKQKK